MMLKRVGIIGLGEYLPERVLTNADLEKMVETSDEWITTRTGIKERRLRDKGEAASDLAIRAASSALEDAHLEPRDIDLVIVATITADMPFPSVSSILQGALQIPRAACFDISAACAGFVYAITTAQQFIAGGDYKNALVVGAETLSAVTDWQDRDTCVLFGDGAGAAVVSEVRSGGILSACLGADGSKGSLLMIPAGGSRHPASHQTVDQR